jgi:hypothetical protein
MAFIGFFFFEKIIVQKILLQPYTHIEDLYRIPKRIIKNFKVLGSTLYYIFLQVIRSMYTKSEFENNKVNIREFERDDFYDLH